MNTPGFLARHGLPLQPSILFPGKTDRQALSLHHPDFAGHAPLGCTPSSRHLQGRDRGSLGRAGLPGEAVQVAMLIRAGLPFALLLSLALVTG